MAARRADRGADSDEPAPRLVKISELARMSSVPTATIKHYLREGLLPGPAKRTSRNMAYYDGRLAARVRAIKELQQERFLPLRIIAEVLEPAPSDRVRDDLDEMQLRQLGMHEPQAQQSSRQSSRQATQQSGQHRDDGSLRPRSHAQVLAEMQISQGDLDVLHDHGLLESVGPQAVFAGPALELLTAIHEIRLRGLGDLLPIESVPAYVTIIRELVRTERELFRRRVLAGARLPDMSLAAITREVHQLSERLIAALRQKLLMDEG